MQQCGFCSMLSGFLRRSMCVGSRRGSSESYYRELGDQDTMKIEDKSSEASGDTEPIPQDTEQAEITRPPDISGELSAITHRGVCVGQFLTIHKRRKNRLVTRSLSQDVALLDDVHFGQVQCILDQSAQWSFNAFTLDVVSGGRCLPVLCVHLFHMYGLLSYFKLDAAKTWKLFSLIEAGYHNSNPYHNSIHAADVTQAMHCFLQQKQIKDHLEPLEILTSLLAAIAHDMDHPGVNQSFLIATSNHLAMLYKNTSVLENHHWRSAVSCLIESGILDQMKEIQAKVEHQISSLILATDITKQQDYLSQFKSYMDTNTLDLTKSEHRHLVLQIALKCADISNPCRPWEISRKWSLKVCEEFFRQGDYERQLNLPVTALCDRTTTSIPRIQTGFFKYVVTPLISEWNRFLQNDLSTQMLENLFYNQTKWEMLVTDNGSSTEISDEDLVDANLETCSGTNLSSSSEMLLPPPPRRCSLNPIKQPSLKDQLRRFSVPLNVFQDVKFKNREKDKRILTDPQTLKLVQSPGGSHLSIHSQLDILGDYGQTYIKRDNKLSTENLLPNSSIASITTHGQASRLYKLKDGKSRKLVRQQTFPPLETVSRTYTVYNRQLFTSNDDSKLATGFRSETGLKFDNNKMETILINLFKRDFKTDKDDAAENNISAAFEPKRLDKDNNSLVHMGAIRKDILGSQLRDNMASMQLPTLTSSQQFQRRKSMPTDADSYIAIPELLERRLSGNWWPHRRGSAPAHFNPADLQAPPAIGSNRQSANGGRRRPNPFSTCHQLLARANYSAQDRTVAHLPRRSSLPVEVLTGI